MAERRPSRGHSASPIQIPRQSQRAMNPFINLTQVTTPLQYLKMIFCFFTLFPIRLGLVILSLGGSAVLATVATAGLSHRQLQEKPLTGWRKVLLMPLPVLTRVFLLGCGFWWVSVDGKPAPKSVAPIVVSNHLGFMEGAYLLGALRATVVSAIENSKIPLVGAFLYGVSAIFVDRTKRATDVAQLMADRAKPDSPFRRQLLVFPEGTVTNQTAVISFKRGSFVPGLPVQPVACRIPFDYCDPCWVAGGPPIAIIMLRLMCQFANRLEVTYLPVHFPTDAEKADATLYARNVQHEIADVLGVEATGHSLEDVQLAMAALKLKLPPQDAVVELQSIRDKIKIDRHDAKKYLKRFAGLDSDRNGVLRFNEFARAFEEDDGSPLSAQQLMVLRRLFTMMADAFGGINFRQFLVVSAILNERTDEGQEKALRLAFSIFCHDQPEQLLTKADFLSILRKPYSHLTDSDLEAYFEEADKDRDGRVNEEEFVQFGMQHKEHLNAYREAFFGTLGESTLTPTAGAVPTTPRKQKQN